MDGTTKSVLGIKAEIDELRRQIAALRSSNSCGKMADERLGQERGDLKLVEAVVGAIDCGLTVRDRDYTLTYMNRVVRDIYGDRRGEKCYRVFEGRDSVCEGCPVEFAYRDGKSHTSLREVISPSGQVEYWENTASPIFASDGAVEACLEINRNVTAQVKSKRELRKTRDFSKKLLETANALIVVLDSAGRIERFNACAEQITGYSKEEVLGRSWFDTFIKKGDQEKIRAVFGNVLEMREGYETFTHEKAILTKDGAERLLDWHNQVIRDESGGISAVIAIGVDVSEQRATEKDLRDSEERFRVFSNAAFEGIVLSENGVLIDANRALLEMFGYDMEELKGRSVIDFVAAEDRELVKSRMLGGFDGIYELKGVHRDGRIVDVEVRGRAVTYQGRELRMTAVRDVTARKEMEEQVKKHRADMAHAWRVNAMGELASGLAHELNQPLTAIANYANVCKMLLDRERETRQQVKEILGDVTAQAERAAEIIRRLRALVIKRPPRQSTFCLNDVVAEALEFEKMDAQARGVIVETELDDALPLLLGDPIQIEQVVLNLVRNGLEAMERIEAGKKRLTVRTCRDDGKVRVEVSDTGVGLSGELGEKVFDSFFTTKESGLGVGLSLSRSIIEAHGGNLRAQTNESGGATFCFSLPVGRRSADLPRGG